MTEIPEDVMKVARDLWRGMYVTQDEAENALARAIMAERERDRWLPIETAPKDGTAFLVPERAVGDRVHVQPCAWMECHLLGGLVGKTWRNPINSQAGLRPVYWQPLPAPPTSKGTSNDAD